MLVADDIKSCKKKKICFVEIRHFVQAQNQAAGRWKDEDETTRQLLLSAFSTMLKFECCGTATHSMDDIDLAGFSMYKSLRGVDCTLPRFVHHRMHKGC